MSFHHPGLQPKCQFTSRSLVFMGLLRVPPRARQRGLLARAELVDHESPCGCEWHPRPSSTSIMLHHNSGTGTAARGLWSRTGSKLRIKRGRWKSVRGDALWYNPVGYDAPQLLYETRPSIITIMDANRTVLHLLKTEMETVWSNRLCLDLICCRLPFSCVCRKLFSQRITWKQIYQHVNKY